MRKTAMQLLIEWSQKDLEIFIEDTDEALRIFKAIKDKATELLETEREQSSQNTKLRESVEEAVKIIDDSTSLLIENNPENIELKVIYNTCREIEKALK